jgi:citrate lyase beta subunit
MQAGEAAGQGAVARDGKLIEYASIRQAHHLVKLADTLAARAAARSA